MIKDRLKYLVIVLAAVFITACSAAETAEPQDEVGKEIISFGVGEMPVATRADIFTSDTDLQNGQKFGGNCMINAWLSNRDQQYIDDARLWYFSHADEWIFLDTSHEVYNHYWPKIEGSSWPLDVIAYSPWTYVNTTNENGDNIQDATKYKSVYTGISDVTRTSDYKVTFKCNLPVVAGDDSTDELDNQDELTEFIYAYAIGKDKTYQDNNNNVVPLKFRHPLSAIYFKLKQAHRDLILQKIVINSLYATGTFASESDTGDSGFSITSGNWTGSGNRTDLTLNISKKIPEDINFNAMVGGPYLVMPQSMTYGTGEKLTMEIYFNWSGSIAPVEGKLEKVDDAYNYKAIIDLSTLQISSVNGVPQTLSSWEPGMRYTYTLDLGDNKEEILFKVLVEPWKTPEADTNIEVE